MRLALHVNLKQFSENNNVLPIKLTACCCNSVSPIPSTDYFRTTFLGAIEQALHNTDMAINFCDLS